MTTACLQITFWPSPTEFSNDRCAPAGAPADIELAAFSRSCYEFNVAKGGSFEEARKQCQSHGGDLIHGFQVCSRHFASYILHTINVKVRVCLFRFHASTDGPISYSMWFVEAFLVPSFPILSSPDNYIILVHNITSDIPANPCIPSVL